MQTPDDVTTVHFEMSGGSVSDTVVASAGLTNCCRRLGYDRRLNGKYTIQSVVTDIDGSSASSPGVSVTVDNHSAAHGACGSVP